MLTDAKLKAAKPREKPYKLADSGQLYLYVAPTGGRHWRMNYTYGVNERGKPAQKTLAFGSYPAVTLLQARAARDAAKAHLATGADPAVERRAAERAKARGNMNTFRVIAERWFELQSGWSLAKLREWEREHGSWSGTRADAWTVKRGRWAPRHADKVYRSLIEDVFPEVGDEPIATLDAPRLLEVLNKVEARGAIETAHRIRQRVSAVFVYAIAAGLAKFDPAASLGKALSTKPPAKRQPAITDLESVRTMLLACEEMRSRAGTKFALRLLALTAVRPGELRAARWVEFEDLEPRFGARAGERVQINQPLWRIPAARMKGDLERKQEVGGDHLVPLSRQAVEVLLALRPLTGDLDLVFPSERHLHRPLSENTLRQMLIRAGYYQQHVPHGFRSAFSTVMNERGEAAGRSADRAIIDLMLAHVPKDKVESAYNRASFMPRRREIAQEWADLLLDGFAPAEEHLGKPMRRSIGNPGNAGNRRGRIMRTESS